LLRELALGLRSPVLALASQNHSAGNYGTGKGSAALDSLKESGDLEYAADVVVFLTEAQERLATPPARAVELTVAKNRHGDTGKVGVIFRPDLGIMALTQHSCHQPQTRTSRSTCEQLTLSPLGPDSGRRCAD
jgi:replicative DNA helicase